VKLGDLVWPQYTDWQSLRDTGELVDRLGYDSQTRHPPIVRAIPPTIGPRAAAEPTTAPRLPNARPRRTAGTTARRRPAPFGKTSAPDTACPILKTISAGRLGASAAPTEASPKTAPGSGRR
jgi:hypothetical protein